MLEALRRGDVEEFGRRQRSDTKRVLESMTNITIIVNKLKGFPIGAPVRDTSQCGEQSHGSEVGQK